MEDPLPAGGRSRELDRRLDGLGAGAREEGGAEIRRRALQQLLGEHAGEQREAELGHVRGLGGERLLELPSHCGVVAAEGEDAVAGEQVEVALAGLVDQVGPLSPDPGPVEADRAQDPNELRIHVALVQRGLLAAPASEDLADVEARHPVGRLSEGGVRSARALPG